MKNLLKKDYTIAILLFLLVFGLYIADSFDNYKKGYQDSNYRRLMVAADTVPQTFLPLSILRDKTINFDKIVDELRQFDGNKERPYFLIQSDGHWYSVYPILGGVMALPFYVVPFLLGKIPDISNPLNISKMLLLGRFAASFYTAASVVIFYYILRRVSDFSEKGWAILFTVFYAFGTNMWSIASRGLWMHTISIFFNSLVVLCLVYSVRHKKYLNLAGLFMGLAVLTRPTNIVLAIVVTLYVFFTARDKIKDFILAALPSALFMLLYNAQVFGSPFSEGYGARSDYDWSTSLFESLPAYAFSPARSFLFISPPLVLAYFSIIMLFTKSKYGDEFKKLFKYLGVGFLLSLLMFAKWYTWDGANGFGYRMLSDYLPIVGLLSFHLLLCYFETSKNNTHLFIRKSVIVVMIVYSIFIHFNATIFRKSRCDSEHNWSTYCLELPTRKSNY